jgi:hypothetical protein
MPTVRGAQSGHHHGLLNIENLVSMYSARRLFHTAKRL